MRFGNLLSTGIVGTALLLSCHALPSPTGRHNGNGSPQGHGPPLSKRQNEDGWPYTPFTTSGIEILDSQGQVVKYAGANWPGSLLTMVPEGLQHASADAIAEQIASLGMNVVRVSWATEMIDDIYEKGNDTDLRTSFIQALGETDGERIYNDVLKHNPQFTPSTTRLEVRSSDCTCRRCNGACCRLTLTRLSMLWRLRVPNIKSWSI